MSARSLTVALLSVAVVSCSPPSRDADSRTMGEPHTSTGCGSERLPDCPLQGWMKANLKPALGRGDGERLAVAFSQLVELAPSDYADWASIARRASAAAARGDLDEVRVACKTCHAQYKERYRADSRDRPVE